MSIDGKQITNYSQFNTSPWLIEYLKESNIVKILESSDPQFNDLEEALFDMLLELWIDTAVGEQLDVLGIHVGIDRDGRSDSDYRTVIRAQIEINISSGEPEALIQAVQILYSATYVEYVPEYPAKIRIYTDITISDPTILRPLLGIIPSGVALLYADNLVTHLGDLIVTDDGSEIVVTYFVE